MTAKILQMVNSAYFGLCRKITRAEEAVSYLGMETVKSLVLSAKIFSQFDQRKMAFFPMDELWDHSLRASMCAKAISRVEQYDKEQVDSAFMACILHDLGKLILAQNLPGPYQTVLSVALRDQRPLWDVEMENIGTSHAQIAAYLMGLWGMPDMIVEAIAFHHQPAASPGKNDILTTVHAANVLTKPLEDGVDSAGMSSVDHIYLQKVGLQEQFSIWQQVCQNISAKGEEN